MSALTASAWKGIAMIVFTLLSIIGFAVAIILKERAKQVYISSGSMFSAGILLAAGFVHLLSDSTGSFSELSKKGLIPCTEDQCFPWSFAIAGVTIVLLVCIELLVTDLLLRNKETHERKKGNTATTEEREVITNSNTVDNEESARDQQIVRASASSLGSILIPGDTEELNWLTALVITIALGIHSVIEAIGIGATNDISEIQSSFVAIAVHKGFTAYALANSLVSCGYWEAANQKRHYFYASTGLFMGLTLLGLAIGWGVSTVGDSSSEDSLTSAILISATAGSFLYVSSIEIIPEEMEMIKKMKLRTPLIILCFLLGFCLMTMLAIWV